MVILKHIPVSVFNPSSLNILDIFLYPIGVTLFSLYSQIRLNKYCW